MNYLKLFRGHMTLYLIFVLCVVALMYSLQKCSSSIPKTNYYQRAGDDTINVAIEISPMSMSLSSDTIGGFYYDLLNLISKKNNVKFKYHEFVPLNFALIGLNSGKFDIVVADIPATKELKENYLITEPIYIDHQVLVQRKNNLTGSVNITEHHQLASDSIWIVAGSPFVDRISNLTAELGCDTIFVFELAEYSSEQLIILTALGEIKQSVVNANIAKAMLKSYPQLDINTKISFNQFQVWLINQNNYTLCNKFNKWILEIKDTDEYEQLMNKYLR